MNIEQFDDGIQGKFFIEEDNEQLAEMVYTWKGNDSIVILHTEVGNRLQGKGAGKLLVARAVDFARAKHIKIIPRCVFAKAVFDKTIEFQDVL